MNEITEMQPSEISYAIKQAIRNPGETLRFLRYWSQTRNEDWNTSNGNLFFWVVVGFGGLGLFASSWPGPFDLVLIPVAIIVVRYTLTAIVRLWRKLFGPARRFRPKRQRGTSLLVIVFLATHYGAEALRWVWGKIAATISRAKK